MVQTCTGFTVDDDALERHLADEYGILTRERFDSSQAVVALFASVQAQGLVEDPGPFTISVSGIEATEDQTVLIGLRSAIRDPKGGVRDLQVTGLPISVDDLGDRVEGIELAASVVGSILARASALIEPMNHLIDTEHLAADPMTPNGFDRRWVQAINQVLVDRGELPEGAQVTDLTDAAWERFLGPLTDAVGEQYHAGGPRDFEYAAEDGQ